MVVFLRVNQSLLSLTDEIHVAVLLADRTRGVFELSGGLRGNLGQAELRT